MGSHIGLSKRLDEAGRECDIRRFDLIGSTPVHAGEVYDRVPQLARAIWSSSWHEKRARSIGRTSATP